MTVIDWSAYGAVFTRAEAYFHLAERVRALGYQVVASDYPVPDVAPVHPIERGWAETTRRALAPRAFLDLMKGEWP